MQCHKGIALQLTGTASDLGISTIVVGCCIYFLKNGHGGGQPQVGYGPVSATTFTDTFDEH